MSQVDVTRRALLAAVATIPTGLAGGVFPSDAGEIALSFVHEDTRIDVPANAVRVSVLATQTFVIEGTGQRIELGRPAVELCLSEDVRAQLRELTKRMVDQPLDMMVGCEVVVRPIVREPIGDSPCLRLSAFDLAEAQSIADKLAGRGAKGCPASRLSAPAA